MPLPESTPAGPQILQPPAWAYWVIRAAGVAGLAYLVYSRPDSLEALFDNPLAIVACLAVLIAPVSFLSLRRIELDDDEIREFRGSRLVCCCAIRDIKEIRVRMGRKILVFQGGERIVLNNGWPGASELFTFLQALVDAKEIGDQQ